MPVSRSRKKRKNQNGQKRAWQGQSVIALSSEVEPGFTPCPRTIEAGQRASEDDRIWFKRHLSATVRVREALLGEHDEALLKDGRGPLGAEERLAVVVVQSAPGRRVRLPYKVMPTQTPGGGLTLQQLQEVQADWEASDESALVTGADGQAHDVLQILRLALGQT